jgi:hypothetical protein
MTPVSLTGSRIKTAGNERARASRGQASFSKRNGMANVTGR